MPMQIVETDFADIAPDPGPHLPSGWALQAGPQRTFYAEHAREGFRTGPHPTAEGAIAEAHDVHAREIAAGELFVDESPDADETERSASNSPDDSLVVVVKESSAPARVVERQRKASFLMRQVHAATLVQAVAIARIHDEGLFEELGFDSWTEFCDVELDMSDRQVRKLRRVAERFQGLLPQSWTEERKSTSDPMLLTSGGDDERKSTSDDNAVALSALGVERLYHLATADDVDVSAVVTEGTVTLPGGKTVTLDELRQKTVKQMGADFRTQKKALRERAQVLEAERDKAEAERDALRQAHEKAEDVYATGKALERRWGTEQTGYEQQKRAISEAHDGFREFRRLAARIAVTPDSDEELRRRTWQMLQDARDLVDRLHVEYHDVVAAELDLSA